MFAFALRSRTLLRHFKRLEIRLSTNFTCKGSQYHRLTNNETIYNHLNILKCNRNSIHRNYSSKHEFDYHCEETLEELSNFFEDLGEIENLPPEYDVELNNGVLRISVGNDFGTYVLNKQSPNKQLWLSSPSSGPKRFDYVDGSWQYSHTKEFLYSLLEKEFSSILHKPIQCNHLKYYK